MPIIYRSFRFCAALAATLLILVVLKADAPAPDKSGYNIFNRTPESQLRELTPDRPDVTESPYTVDAGWWQAEMDFFNSTHDHNTSNGANFTGDATSYLTLNLKVGLTNRIDLQTVLEPINHVAVRDNASGVRTSISGFGDITSRLKINFWGDDGGGSAFGMMPFVKWPTNRHGLGNHYIEGGLILPYARDLPAGWDVGMMTELDIVRNDANDGYTTAWVNSATFGHDIAGKFGGYLELTSTLRQGADLATFDCGITCTINKHFQLDCGAAFGLTRASDDLNFFSGFTYRF